MKKKKLKKIAKAMKKARKGRFIKDPTPATLKPGTGPVCLVNKATKHCCGKVHLPVINKPEAAIAEKPRGLADEGADTVTAFDLPPETNIQSLPKIDAPMTQTLQPSQQPAKTILYVAFEKGSGFVGDCIDDICDGAYCHAELNLRYGMAYRCHLQGNDRLIDPSPYDDGWTLVPVELDAAAALAWCEKRDNSVYNLAGALAFLPRKWGWDGFADWIERLSRKGQVFCSESVAEICNDCGGPNFGIPQDIDPVTLFKALKVATDLPILTGTQYEAQFAPK